MQHCFAKKSQPGRKDKLSISVPAPQNWWKETGLLPSTPQPAPTGTGEGPLCAVRFADGGETVVPAGSIIIPDTQTAYYVGATAPCAVDSLVRLSSRDGLMATVGGGRYAIDVPNRVIPAAAVLANPVTAEELTLAFDTFGGVVARWLATNIADIVATGRGLAIILNQLNAEASNKTIGDAPTIPEVDAALSRLPGPSTALAEKLSMGEGPGNCNRDDLDRMEEAKDHFCDAPEKGATTCKGGDTPSQLLIKARVRAICARMRGKIMDECYDGGNRDHRDQAIGHWNAVRKCLNLLSRP